jgi:hypothetical protein
MVIAIVCHPAHINRGHYSSFAELGEPQQAIDSLWLFDMVEICDRRQESETTAETSSKLPASPDSSDPGRPTNMTSAVRELISRFERLDEHDQVEAAREIIRRTAMAEIPPLTDEDLTALADELFIELEREEQP